MESALRVRNRHTQDGSIGKRQSARSLYVSLPFNLINISIPKGPQSDEAYASPISVSGAAEAASTPCLPRCQVAGVTRRDTYPPFTAAPLSGNRPTAQKCCNAATIRVQAEGGSNDSKHLLGRRRGGAGWHEEAGGACAAREACALGGGAVGGTPPLDERRAAALWLLLQDVQDVA